MKNQRMTNPNDRSNGQKGHKLITEIKYHNNLLLKTNNIKYNDLI